MFSRWIYLHLTNRPNRSVKTVNDVVCCRSLSHYIIFHDDTSVSKTSGPRTERRLEEQSQGPTDARMDGRYDSHRDRQTDERMDDLPDRDLTMNWLSDGHEKKWTEDGRLRMSQIKPSDAIQCHAEPSHTISSHTMSYHAMLCYFLPDFFFPNFHSVQWKLVRRNDDGNFLFGWSGEKQTTRGTNLEDV